MRVIRNTIAYFRAHGFMGTLWRISLEFRRRIIRPQMAHFVELMGNRWKMDGCTFVLSSPLIPHYSKCTFVSGKYERDMRGLIKRHLCRGGATIELGASIGVVSCITNSLLDDPKAHVVVEANPEIIPLLEANKEENKSGFTVKYAAIAYGSDTVPFYVHKKSTGGSVHFKTDKEVKVPTISLKQILDESGFNNVNLIVDIEGAEIPLIANEADVIGDHVRKLFIEMHPPESKEIIFHRKTPQDEASANALRTLEKKGFVLIDQSYTVYVLEKKK